MTRSFNAFGLIALLVLLGLGAAYYYLKEEVPTLYINEFMANNISCCPDTDSGTEEFNDWIEIYNPGAKPIDIGGMYFSQNKKKPLGHKIPKTNSKLTTVPPGGYLVLWADGSANQGILHLTFKLNQNGEYIGLYHEDGRKIDGLEFGAQTANKSLGRITDGNTEWKIFDIPSPGKKNN